MALLELLQELPWFLYTTVTLVGLLFGSFLNVVIHRLPLMLEQEWDREARAHLNLGPDAPEKPNQEPSNQEPSGQKPAHEAPSDGEPTDDPANQASPRLTLSRPRSRCPKCGHTITAWENIPVLSWLLLRGRCASCSARISVRYPLIELLTAILSVAVIHHFGPTAQGVAGLILTWALIALCFIDLDTLYLPDQITLPWLWLGMALSLFGLFSTPVDSIIGAIAGYMTLWLVYHAFRLITGKEGMGYGDFKLLALFGAWLGWQILPVILFLASVVGAILGLILIKFRGHDADVPIPFGPYLAIAGWIALLWGEQLIELWLGPAGHVS